MQISLLDHLRCVACHGRLDAFADTPPAGRPDDPTTLAEGLLVCRGCARWFPVIGTLPELLPDHLRDWTRDQAVFDRHRAALPPALGDRASAIDRDGHAADGGAHYKKAEIAIKGKVTDPGFFEPGYSSPFNPSDSDFSLYLIRLFGNVVPLLEARRGSVIVDSGCGYSWTTEWLFKSGFMPIGVDICRSYLEIATERMGAARPHLVVADVENLPLAEDCVDAVLAYESFHHVPNRARAMAGYARVLKDGGRVVLAEPRATHEHAIVSVDVMEKFGILEKGMDKADVEEYIAALPFDPPEQHYVLEVTSDDLTKGITASNARSHTAIDGNVFRLRKNAARGEPRRGRPPAASADRALHGDGACQRAAAGASPAIAIAEPFDQYYFQHCCGRPYGRDPEWLEFFGTIADRIVADFAPARLKPRPTTGGPEGPAPLRVLDAGCAMGLLVEALRARGVEAWGVDVSGYAIARVDEGARPYCRRDSITTDFGERYDLITCIEVLEHMPPQEAERALDNICAHTDDVLFSSTPLDYQEPTHVNVHPPEHWAELFARRGFFRDVDHDASYVTSWAVRFRRSEEPIHRLVRAYERRTAAVLAERGDNRRYAARLQRELAAALQALDELRQTHTRLTAQWSAQMETTANELREAQADLIIARDRIEDMERSAFWKLRNIWVRVSRLLGRNS